MAIKSLKEIPSERIFTVLKKITSPELRLELRVHLDDNHLVSDAKPCFSIITKEIEEVYDMYLIAGIECATISLLELSKNDTLKRSFLIAVLYALTIVIQDKNSETFLDVLEPLDYDRLKKWLDLYIQERTSGTLSLMTFTKQVQFFEPVEPVFADRSMSARG